MGRLIHGVLAGAAGTALLNLTTYLDMAVRARPPSDIPQQDVDALARRAGVSLGDDEQTAETRRSALGALSGFATGLGIGVVYGRLRPKARGVPRPIAAALAGAAAMAATDGISTLLGTTDPRRWPPESWAADAIPHLAYGVGLVSTFDALER